MDVIEKKKYKRKAAYKLGVEFEPVVGEMLEEAIEIHNKKYPLNQINKSSLVRGKVKEFIEETFEATN